MLRVKHQRHRDGFTFVELMIGIIVTSIVLCALSVFLFGVGQNWQDSDSAQSAFLAASMGVDRINQIVRSAQAIGSNPTPGSLNNSTTPATCMLWTDLNGDGAIQYDEMTLLEYDPTNQLLSQYAIPATASNAVTQSGALLSTTNFQTLPNVVKSAVVHDVSACQILYPTTGTGARPSLEIILQMTTASGSSKTLVYTTVTLRAPG